MRRPWQTVLLMSLTLTSASLAGEPIKVPPTKRIDHTDTYHGTTVADPYRWLEDDVRKSSEVADWVEAQNKGTFAFLESIPARKPLQARLKELWNYERYSIPFKA